MSRASDSTARWREIVRDQARSGLSVVDYCRRARVPVSSFYAWRRKLQDGAVTFAEVRVSPQRGDGRLEVGALELRLANGRCVVVRSGFDRRTLRDLLAVLEADA